MADRSAEASAEEAGEGRGARAGGFLAFLRAVMPWLRPQVGALVAGSVALLVFVLLEVVPAFVYRVLYDDAVPERDTALLLWLFAVLGGCVVVQGVMAAVRARVFGRLSAQVGVALRGAMVERVQRVDLADPRVRRRAQVLALFGADIEAVEAATLVDLPRALQGAFAAVAGVVVLLVLDWRLTLVLVVAGPLSGAGSWLLSGRASAAQARRSGDREALDGVLDDLVRGQRTIRAYGLTSYWAERFGARLSRLGESTRRAGALTVGVQSATVVATLGLAVVVLVAATAMVFLGWFTVGGLIGFISVLFTAMGGVTTMSESAPGLLRAREALRRVDGLLAAPIVDAGGAEAPPLRAGLTLEGVRLAFVPDRWVLDGLDLHVARGESVAIVGPSGAGKSTVLGVLLGFERPQQGQVRWDAQPFEALAIGSVRARMAVVFQETELFAMSIADNIRLGRLDASDDAVRAAARAAELDDVIAALPDGYDTMLGDGHHRLSGGQRQRLAIARAVLRDPEVLLLDEATSALDAGTEAAINDTLERLTGDRTVVSVTHRLESARRADRIVVMRDGVVAETGTHDALIAAGGLYADLYRRQQAVRVDRGAPRIEAAFLAEVPLFAELPTGVHAELVEAFVAERRQPGEVVIRAGEPGDRLYVVVRGQLSVEVAGRDGVARVGTLRDADVFGEVALLIDVPRSATVTAQHETLLVSLARADFVALLDAHPEARAMITAEAERRLASVRAVTAG